MSDLEIIAAFFSYLYSKHRVVIYIYIYSTQYIAFTYTSRPSFRLCLGLTLSDILEPGDSRKLVHAEQRIWKKNSNYGTFITQHLFQDHLKTAF